MQTIGSMSKQKARKIGMETIIYFVPFSMLFDMLSVSAKLIELSEAVTTDGLTKKNESFYSY
jgi:hypothetical protein